jgi:hypothetical protein
MSVAVAEHLGACSACSQELAEWRALDDAMHVRDQQVPPDIQASEGWIRLEAELPVIGLETSHSTRRHSLSTRYRLIPAIAALLLIALGSAVFGVMMQGRISHAPTATRPIVCAPNQISNDLPKGAWLQDLDMTSPDSGWATGHILGTSDNTPFIAQYRHCRWRAVQVSRPDVFGLTISALSPSDAWVFGYHVRGNVALPAYMTPFILHYTGGRWRQVTVPNVAGKDQHVVGFAMVSDEEGWLSLTKPHCPACAFPYQVYHGVDGVWSLVNPPTGYQSLWLVGAFPSGVAWLAADNGTNREDLILYHNSVFSSMYILPSNNLLMPAAMAAPRGESPEVSMDTPEDAWINAGNLLVHCSLSFCSRLPLDYPSRTTSGTDVNVAVFAANAGWAFSVKLRALVPEEYFNITGVYRLQDGQWQPFPWPYQNVKVLSEVHDVVQVAPDEYWAIAGETLLHYVKGRWYLYS